MTETAIFSGLALFVVMIQCCFFMQIIPGSDLYEWYNPNAVPRSDRVGDEYSVSLADDDEVS